MPTHDSIALHIDTTALTRPLDRRARNAYRRTLPPSVRPPLGAAVILAVATLILLTIFAGPLSGVIERNLLTAEPHDTLFAWAMLLPLVIAFVIAGVVVGRTIVLRTGTRQYRLSRLAAENALFYEPADTAPVRPGMIFEQSADSLSRDVLVFPDYRGLLIGNHTFTTGSGRSKSTHRWGFASLQLNTPLPHIVLDATGNNSLAGTTLPFDPEREQRLRLEGDFDRHFTLWCPRGYEADALYLFSPDIMARFIDHAAELDIEIIDDRLNFYSRKDLSTIDPEVWRWILTTVAAVAATIDRWEQWRDDRLPSVAATAPDGETLPLLRPPRGVARQGRRLTQKVPWFWIILGLIFGAIGIYGIIDDIIGAVTGGG